MPIDSKKATTSLSWCEVFVEGADRPSSREGHTLSYFEGSLYLFGGRDVYCTTSELWQYHIEAAVWTKWVLSGTPPPRLEHHASLLYDRKMFLFGGSLLSDSVLWVFDFDLFEWNKYSFKKGEAPSNRHSHTLTSCNNLVYLYGGYTTLGLESDELWQYDIDSNVWTQLCTEGPSPPPLFGHTAVLYGGLLWILGGTSSRIIQDALWCYDIELCSWRRVACTFHPPPLYRHVAIRAGDTMLVYGGTTDDLASYKGLWRFNFDIEEWTQMISKELPAMSCHAGVVTYSQGTEHRISSAHSGPRIEVSKGGEQWTEDAYITPNSSLQNHSRPQDIELSEMRPSTTMSVVSKLSAASDEADTLPGMVADDQGYRSHHASSSPPPVIPSVWENANVCDKLSPTVQSTGPGFCVTNPIFSNQLDDPVQGTRDSGRGSVVNFESPRSTVSSGYNDNEQLNAKQQTNQIVFLADRDSLRERDSGEDSGSQGSRSSLKKRRYKQCHSTTFYIAGHGPDAMSQSLVLYKCKIG